MLLCFRRQLDQGVDHHSQSVARRNIPTAAHLSAVDVRHQHHHNLDLRLVASMILVLRPLIIPEILALRTMALPHLTTRHIVHHHPLDQIIPLRQHIPVHKDSIISHLSQA